MPKSYKDEEKVSISALPAYAIHNVHYCSQIKLEKETLWQRLTNKIYNVVTFWQPIIMYTAVYCACMYVVFEALDYASR